MSQKKLFYYDQDTMSFVEVEEAPQKHDKPKFHWGMIGGVAIAVLAVAGTLMYRFSSHDTAESYKLRNENQALKTQLTSFEKRFDAVFSRLEELYKKDSELYRVVLQVDPISEDVRQAGTGGTDDYEQFDGFGGETGGLMRRLGLAIDKLERQLTLQGSSYRELITIARQRKDEIASKPILVPVEGGRITSGFGYRIHPIARVRRMHDGLDFVIPVGTPVYATADGVVEFSGTKGGYGNCVVLKHEKSGYGTLYGHLSKLSVSQGQAVKRGQVIAYSGNTGSSTGPHLHYEVQSADGAQKFNPIDFIAPSMTPSSLREAIKNSESEASSLDF